MICNIDSLLSLSSILTKYNESVIFSQCVEVEQRRMQSCILFMNLKKLNRLAHMRLKRGRDQTHEVKKKIFWSSLCSEHQGFCFVLRTPKCSIFDFESLQVVPQVVFIWMYFSAEPWLFGIVTVYSTYVCNQITDPCCFPSGKAESRCAAPSVTEPAI